MSKKNMAPFKQVKDHGGVREEAVAGGGAREAATGKGRFDLVPAYPLLRLALHYEAGAIKYTTDVTVSVDDLPAKLVAWCTCANRTVIQTAPTTPAASAAPATSANYATETPASRNGSGQTLDNGPKATSRAKSYSTEPISSTRATGVDSASSNARAHSARSASRLPTKSACSSGSTEAAVSVVALPGVGGFTSIMTTAQERCAGSFVASATKASDFSATISRVLNAHEPTCGVHRVQLSEVAGGVRIFRSGDRNWEKGMSLARCVESTERHINQFKDGDRSEDHLAAVLWNVCAYIWTEREVLEGRLPKELADGIPWPASTAADGE